ncbi:hypothetical protein B0H14DRAFT_2620883 [Mycena olivaceomarginata]|nr:hypothetical protein B0H14DRAFT_2620883 [Mycena olivaceomarginata]
MSVAKRPGVKRGAQSRLVPSAPRPVLRGCFAPGILFDARNAAECWLRAQDSKNTIENTQGSSVEHKAGWCLALHILCCAGANASPDRHDAAGCWLRTQDSKNTICTYMCKKWGRPPAKHVSIVAPLFPLTIPRTLNPKCYKAFCRVIRYRIFAVTDFELVFCYRKIAVTNFELILVWVFRYRIFAVTDFGMGVPLPHFCGNGFGDSRRSAFITMRCFAPKQVWVILVIILCRGEAFQAVQAVSTFRTMHKLLKEAGDSLPEASFLILSGSQIWNPPNVFLPDATIELGVERERVVSSASRTLSKNGTNAGQIGRSPTSVLGASKSISRGGFAAELWALEGGTDE